MSARTAEPTARTAVSDVEWRRRRVRLPWQGMHAVLLGLLLVWCVGPLVLLAKYAVTPTQDILSHPLALFPHGVAWGNVAAAWNDVHVSR